MKNFVTLVTIVIFLTTSSFAHARQDAVKSSEQTEDKNTTKPDNTIVVIGEKEFEDQVRDYVRKVIATPSGMRFKGQYGRLEKPLCARAYGLSDTFNKAIADRITAVARASEVPVAGPNCRPNAFVIVIDKGKETIDSLRKKHHRIFGTLQPSERNRIANAPGPVFRWQLRSEVNSADGAAPPLIGPNDAVDVGALASILNDSIPLNTRVEPSRIISPTKQQVTASYLLLEEEALLGLTTTQIADYAAMSLMLEVSNNQNIELNIPSILSLFDDQKAGRELPESVSEWDLVLLHGWYSIPLDRSAALQRAALLQIIKDEMRSSSTR